MEKLSSGQKRLIAEFLSNIGVAWFAAGVIGAFPFWKKTWQDVVISFLWGTIISGIFLRGGLSIIKGGKS